MGLKPKLIRQMGLFTVIATGVSSMVGASINVVPFMIHRSVPNLGPNDFGLLLLQLFLPYLQDLPMRFFLRLCHEREGVTSMRVGG